MGSAAYTAWQNAIAQLPAGYTMGDPTTPLWGAAYYNGVKLMSEPDDAATSAAIHAAADAAYRIYAPIDSIRSSTNPDMQAVLLDPEWIALEGTGQPVMWNSLSPELQAKIKRVPNLYNSLIGNLSALTPPLITSGPTVATGPARYVQGGIEFLDDGTVISYNGTPVPSGTVLTPAEVQSLMTTGALPPGDSGPGGMVPVKAPPAPVPDAPPAPSSSSVATPAPSSSPVPYTFTPPAPSPYTPALVNTYGVANDSTATMPTGGGGGGFSTGAGATSSSGQAVGSTGLSPMVRALLYAAGAAAVVFVATHSRPSRTRRRRRR
jgi:hypothetical protein